MLPLALVFIDMYRERSITWFRNRGLLKAYIPFTGIVPICALYYLADSGLASLAGRRTAGYYGFHGFAGVLAGIVRALINILLPFSTALGFKDIHWWHVALIVVELAVLLVLAWRFKARYALLMAAGWLVCTIAPTAAFAAAVNADRYLFVPMLGPDLRRPVGALDTCVATGRKIFGNCLRGSGAVYGGRNAATAV